MLATILKKKNFFFLQWPVLAEETGLVLGESAEEERRADLGEKVEVVVEVVAAVKINKQTNK